MKRVHDVQRLRVGVHVKFRRLLDDGEEICGQCVGQDRDGRAQIVTADGENTHFSYAEGHRLFWMGARAPGKRAEGDVPVVARERLDKVHKNFKLATAVAVAGALASLGLVAGIVLKVF